VNAMPAAMSAVARRCNFMLKLQGGYGQSVKVEPREGNRRRPAVALPPLARMLVVCAFGLMKAMRRSFM
jgi:hypothetical protein